jgi:hypothetical protein
LCSWAKAAAWSGSVQSKRYGFGAKLLAAGVSLPFAVAWASAKRGSSPEIAACTLRVACMPAWFKRSRKSAGLGNRSVFQFQPAQEFGAFQSVSITSESSGTLCSRNAGSRSIS